MGKNGTLLQDSSSVFPISIWKNKMYIDNEERIKCILTMNMLYEYYFQDEFPPFRYLDFVHIKRGTYSFKVDYR